MGNYVSHKYIFCPPQPHPTFTTYQSQITTITVYDKDIQINLYNIPVYTSSSIDATIFVTEIKPKHKSATTKAAIWSYGNACDMHLMLPILVGIAKTLQIPIYVYDYPGYGLSGGAPSENACIEALEAVTRSVIMRNRLTAQQLVLIGQSLGSAITIGFAYKHRADIIPGQIILLSPFKTAASVITENRITEYAYAMAGGDTFSTISKIGSISTPIKIYHGKIDDVIPFKHAIELQKAHSGTRLILLPYANHNNILTHINMITLLD